MSNKGHVDVFIPRASVSNWEEQKLRKILNRISVVTAVISILVL